MVLKFQLAETWVMFQYLTIFLNLYSIPIIGTKNNVMKLRKNNTIDRFINNF